jgi:thiamine pyrophosphokinase
MKMDKFSETVILANGGFPQHEIPLGCLRSAKRIICCDGAAQSLLEFGLEPFAIVGDCDSLTPGITVKYSGRIFRSSEQDTNDLTKSVKWCSENGFNDLVILGATGKREDHTIGNISLLADYAASVNVKMLTDTGIFVPVTESIRFGCFKGQQVSIFSIDPETKITSVGLKYPLVNRKLKNWWEATLNEATGDSFELEFNGGPLIVFLKFL